ncbi:MAG: hypothetical protein HY260_15120 [Chloroflexi bacterium]|nr:hypothetical protein [Chloroflexota bacterium]
MAKQPPSSRQWQLALADLLEFRFEVRVADSEHSQTIFGLLPALVLAAGLRLYAVLRFPFLHDEPRLADGLHGIMGYGPSATVVGSWPGSFFFGGPLAGGAQNITPLWWWLDFAVLRVWPGNETLALRLPTFAFGLIGIVLFYGLARELFAPPIPALLTWLLAVDDIYLWLGTKAQFVEPAIFVAALIVAHALLVWRNRWAAFVAAGLAATAALGYFLLKGLMLTAHALAVGAAQAIWPRGDGWRFDWGLILRRAVVGVAIGLPLVGWLLAAQMYIDSNYQVRIGDVGYFHSIAKIVLALTLGYGTVAHAGQTGSPATALLYYSHADAWPTTTFLALWIVAGFGWAVWTLYARRDESRETRWHVALYIVIVIILGLAPVISKSVAGERFHMPYFAAALLAVGLVLEQLWQGAKGYALSRSVHLRRLIVLGVIIAGVALSLVRGPLDWGLTAPYSPEPYNGILQLVEAKYHPK